MSESKRLRMESTIYQLIDNQTGRVIATYTYAKRKLAHRRRDKLDLAYGAIRYTVKPIFADEQLATASTVQK